MTKKAKNLQRILNGNGKNVQFDDFINAILASGFDDRRQSGTSHHIFKDAHGNMMNIQPSKDGKAKSYQVKQLQSIIQERKS